MLARSDNFKHLLNTVKELKSSLYYLAQEEDKKLLDLTTEFIHIEFLLGTLPIADLGELPEKPGIYFLVSKENQVLYVGMSQKLKTRFIYIPDSACPNDIIFKNGDIVIAHTQMKTRLKDRDLSKYSIKYIAFEQIDKECLLALEGFYTYLFNLSNETAYKKFQPQVSRYKTALKERLDCLDKITNFWLCFDHLTPEEMELKQMYYING